MADANLHPGRRWLSANSNNALPDSHTPHNGQASYAQSADALPPDVLAKLNELSALSEEAPNRILAAALNLYELALLAASHQKKMAVVDLDQPAITEVVGIGAALDSPQSL